MAENDRLSHIGILASASKEHLSHLSTPLEKKGIFFLWVSTCSCELPNTSIGHATVCRETITYKSTHRTRYVSLDFGY